MTFTVFLRGKKTKWILPAAAAALIAVAVIVPVFYNAGAKTAVSEQKVYKETKVQRGDITVGVTESGTATINTNSVTCDLEGAEIEKIYIKAGQSVSRGDAVARLTEESVNGVLKTYQLALDQSEIKLEQAKSAQTTGKVNAKNAYESSVFKQKNAQNTYDSTIASLNNAVTSAQAAVDDCTGTITYYETRLANNAAVIYAEFKLDALKTAWDTAEAALASNTDPAKAASLQKAADDAENANNSAAENFNSEVSKESSALASRKSSLSSLEQKVKQAKLDLESGTLAAQNQMESDISAGKNALEVYNAAIASLQSVVDMAQYDNDTAYENYDKYSHYLTDPTVYSDYSGLVMSVGYAAGGTISQMNHEIASITDNTAAYVNVSVSQDDISDIAVGDTANVSFGSFEGTKFTGTIDSITITPAREQSSTVSYTVSVKLTGEGVEKLYEGMTGDVTFVSKEVKDVLYVSNKAITAENGVQTAKVKNSQGVITTVEVTTGFSDGQNTEVVSGLTEGQTVIIESQAVKPE